MLLNIDGGSWNQKFLAPAGILHMTDFLFSINFYMGDRLRRVASPDSVPPGAWLLTDKLADGMQGDTISRRGADTRRPIILVPPRGVTK